MKILLFDIETSPNLAYVWGKYQQDAIAFESEWRLLSVAYKWLGESKVHCITTQGEKGDKKLCKEFREVMEQADVLVAHNGDEFDIKKVKARFAINGLRPVKHLSSIDTKKVAKANFAFTSNKLDDLGKVLGVGRKVKTGGFDLWLDVMADKASAWKRMSEYNKQDVLLLERIYMKLRPWMAKHPTLTKYSACNKCGSTNFYKCGIRANSASILQQMRCKDCGGYFLTPISKRGKN